MVQPEPYNQFYNQPIMTLVSRLLCDWLTYSCVWLTSPSYKNLVRNIIFSVFLENYRIFQRFNFDFGEFSQNLLFVCLLQKACNFGKVSKNVILNMCFLGNPSFDSLCSSRHGQLESSHRQPVYVRLSKLEVQI